MAVFRTRRVLSIALLAVWTVAFLGLGGCGGGGGGGGGGSGSNAAFLKLVANMFFGQKTAGGTTTTPYPTDPTLGVPVPPNSGAYQVPAAVFPLGALGNQSFIELRFNRTLLASSIISPVPSGSDGIVLFVIQNGPGGAPPCVLASGNPVCLRLDSAGIIDASNAFVGTEAPAILRLYYDPDNNLTTPDVLPTADYSLVITNNLKAANGGPFCVGAGSAGCSNPYLPVMPFTIGPNTTALDMSSTTPMVPVCGESAAPINSEIILNFIDSVDFFSVVGGAANLTALDPFISIPFMIGAGPQGNVTLAYNAPVDPVTQVPQTLPGNLGYVIYMPDPILNPTQIRIRFVDLTGLQPLNTGGPGNIWQNYASNPLKYPIASQDPLLNNATLQLPPIKAVPGSFLGSNNVVGPATVAVAVGTGVTDRANLPGGTGNALSAAFNCSFTWAVGPGLARNPVGPDAVYVGSLQGGQPPLDKPGITIVDTAHTTGSNANCTNLPATYGVPVTGILTPMPAQNRIANTAVLGVPGDIEVGSFLNAGGTITNAPRGTIVPGVVDDQNGTPPLDMLVCLGVTMNPQPPPYGNRLYITDLTANALKVFNSYDFSLITTIAGVASPTGLGVSPDLGFIYVSNGLQGTIQRINANPVSPQFHTIVNTITVGNGPKAISVHPANEDVLVCNYAENSISFVRPSTQLERAKFSTGLGPSDAFITRRMVGMGLTNEWMAFIPNLFSNTVTVYESAGGGVVLENVPEGRIIGHEAGFLGPAHGTWNWTTYINIYPSGLNGPGCFIANSLGSSVDRLYLSNFTLSPPPGFPGPAGTRTFTHGPVGTTYSNPSDVCIDNMSGLYNINVAGITNNKVACDQNFGGGLPSVLVASYPGLGKCVAYDYNSPAFFAEVAVGGCDFLQTYYDQ